MSNQKAKSTKKSLNVYDELLVVRHDIRNFRRTINESLDAMEERINVLLPPVKTARTRRLKNFTKNDWKRFLTF